MIKFLINELHCQVIDYGLERLQDYRATGLQDYRATGLQGYRTTGLLAIGYRRAAGLASYSRAIYSQVLRAALLYCTLLYTVLSDCSYLQYTTGIPVPV